MFSKITVVLSTLAIVATAAPGGGVNQCNTGNAQCCNQVHQSQSAEAENILGNAVGLGLGDITAMIGAQCSPLTIIGATVSGNCNSKAVCCTGQDQTGLVNVGCVPISL